MSKELQMVFALLDAFDRGLDLYDRLGNAGARLRFIRAEGREPTQAEWEEILGEWSQGETALDSIADQARENTGK